MGIKKLKSILSKDDGSAIGLFIAILLSITLLATASITLAKTQYTWARFSRQTSNSYHLARSGAEKIVDSMNKEIAKVLPDLTKKASEVVHTKLLGEDRVRYKGNEVSDSGLESNPYDGKYIGSAYENEYERQLKKLIYDHIASEFALDNASLAKETDYEAVNSDVSKDIQIQTKVYKKGTANVPEEIASTISNLITSNEMETLTDEDIAKKDAFIVEVTAWAAERSKSSLTKSRVVGAISLDQVIPNEELLEEYEWAGVFPETIQSAVVSFGDFVINEKDTAANINGDIHVKGTRGPEATEAQAKTGDFPGPDESGGIVISNGGKLVVDGSAMVVNNIQTSNSIDNKTEPTSIHIKKDAIANTIAINNTYSESDSPWENYTSGNSITIDKNVYMDNDLRIDRYVSKSKIKVGKSVFGISDGDSDGTIGDTKVHVDPNKSSGIYAMGKFDVPDDNSTIEMGRAFIAGQAFINFGDGNGFHRLYESAGEPFEDVYYLEEYRTEYGSSVSYISDYEDLIDKNKIRINDKNILGKLISYAPGYISESNLLHDAGVTQEGMTNTALKNQSTARALFYKGLLEEGITEDMKKNIIDSVIDKYKDNSDWDIKLMGTDTKWIDVIYDPEDFYRGSNTFKKNYLLAENYNKLIGYKGLQGYMLGKRGVFYNHFVEGGTTGLVPVEGGFRDLINTSMFNNEHKWSINNPIEVITGSTATIDISAYKNQPTAIICTDPSAIINLTKSDNDEFTGIIIVAGRLEIKNSMTINGIVIAGNESPVPVTKDAIYQGDYAGIKISGGSKVNFNYSMDADKDMIFDIRFMDKSLQRKLYDCLGMTNYASAPEPTESPNNDKERMDAIFGPIDKRKVKLSKESVISAKQEGHQFVMRSLKKIKN